MTSKRVDRHRKRDGNHAEIVQSLLGVGYSVADTADVGHGFPDLVVAAHGRNYLFEIKNPEQPPSKRRLTPDEAAFRDNWRGQYDVIETWEDAVKIIAQKLKEQFNGTNGNVSLNSN